MALRRIEDRPPQAAHVVEERGTGYAAILDIAH
jgi:hypothetical protein